MIKEDDFRKFRKEVNPDFEMNFGEDKEVTIILPEQILNDLKELHKTIFLKEDSPLYVENKDTVSFEMWLGLCASIGSKKFVDDLFEKLQSIEATMDAMQVLKILRKKQNN